MKKLAILPLLALMGCTGCTSVESRISVQTPQGHIEMKLPKDARFDALVYTRSFVDTNGCSNTVTLLITNGNFRMNPEVVDAKTRHDVEVFKAGTAAAIGAISAVPK